MGADNYIVIRKEGRKYKGYTQFAQVGVPEQFIHTCFVVTSLIKAIKQVQDIVTAYGYRIDGI